MYEVRGLFMQHVQIVNNYDITRNEAVRKKYPKLYEEVLKHDKLVTSSWYDLTERAFKEYQRYCKDETIPYLPLY